MQNQLKVAPSILSADFGHMAEAVKNVELWGADMVHCDVMDGVYVPNITFGMPMVRDLRSVTKLDLDVHLMIVKPEKYVKRFLEAGADIVTFHPEASDDVAGALQIVREYGKRCGLAVNADVDLDVALPYLAQIDMLVIMTVQAGFGGQSFKAECLKKAERAAKIKAEKELNFDIEVDGGCCPANARLLYEAGATVAVAGNAVFKSKDPKKTVESMQRLLG